MHPITIIPLIALVTLIKGVCKAGVTFQITKYPVKIARMNTPKLIIKCKSVTYPKATAITNVMIKVMRALQKLELRFYAILKDFLLFLETLNKHIFLLASFHPHLSIDGNLSQIFPPSNYFFHLIIKIINYIQTKLEVSSIVVWGFGCS